MTQQNTFSLQEAGLLPTEKSAPPKPRMIQLDILRGIAILLVLGSHTPFDSENAGLFRPFARFLERFGGTGVDLFFVLSGFLIGGLLFKEIRASGKLDLPRFFIRRGLKIFPSYYLLVLVGLGLVLARTHGNLGESLRTMFPNFIHIQNYWPDDNRPIGQTWSLAVEEHFYLGLPLFLLLMLRGKARTRTSLPAVPIATAVVLVFCLAYRCIVNSSAPYLWWKDLFPTHIRIDSLIFGVLLAYFYHFYPQKLAVAGRNRPALLVTGLALLSPMFFLERATVPFVWTVGFTMLYLGYGCLLVALLYSPVDNSPTGRLIGSKSARLLAWVGTYSYTIYLWFGMLSDRPVTAVFRHVHSLPPSLLWPLSTLLYVVLAVAAGYVMGKLVDGPSLALRDRLFPARASALHN